MQCQRCNSSLKEGETYNIQSKALCEDCYMYVTNPPRACDPMAVASALSVRKQLGQTGSVGLNEQQRRIYETVEKHGEIAKEDLSRLLGIKLELLEQEFAFFRHCELLRAFRQDGKVYVTKWESNKP